MRLSTLRCVDSAMAKKDYSTCEKLQETLTSLEARRAEAEAIAASLQPASAAQIQGEIDQAKEKLDAALAAKQFDKCEVRWSVCTRPTCDLSPILQKSNR